MNYKIDQKTLSTLVLTVAIIFGSIILFGRETSSRTITKAGNLLAGERMEIPQNRNWQDDINTITQTEEVSEELKTETTTDLISQNILGEYLALKENNFLPIDQKESIIKNNLDIFNQTITDYKSDFKINTIKDNGRKTIAEYGENLGLVFKKYKPKEKNNEIEIFKKAIDEKNKSDLNKLKEAVDIYKLLLLDLEKINVPQTFKESHTDLLIGLSMITSGLEDMILTLDDPIKGAQGLQKFQEGGALFIDVISETIKFINKNRIIYKQGDGGYYLLYGI